MLDWIVLPMCVVAAALALLLIDRRPGWRHRRARLLASALLLPSGVLAAAAAPPVHLAPLVGGFAQPTYIIHAGDSSGRVFVVEQPGSIRIIKNGGVLPTPFLDITARVRSSGSEEGLLSVAFPPGYASLGHFYVYYTNLGGNNVVARYEVTADPDLADPNSEEIVLTLSHPTYDNHNGGQLAFGPLDGYLYIGTGDGGGSGDPNNNAQNPDSLLGKLLRIDVETGDPLTYTVPATNPYTETVGYRDEIWALGARNPWRFSFDRQTGDLYIGDVGQNEWEEVDFQPASSPGGENYGWRILEGTHCYEPPVGCVPPERYSPPVTEYDHSLGCAITGGFVYRGPRNPRLRGVYLFSDYCSGNLWGLKFDGVAWRRQLLNTAPFGISTFGEDQAGNLYVADYFGGNILRLF